MNTLFTKKKYKYDLKNYDFLIAIKIFNYEFFKLKMSKKRKFRFVGTPYIKKLILRLKETKKIKRRLKWKLVKRKKFWRTKYKIINKILKYFTFFNYDRFLVNYKLKYKYNIKNYIIMNVRLTYNNISIVITKPDGAVLIWATSGLLKFKGSQKHSFVANYGVARRIYKLLKSLKTKKIKLIFKGHTNKIRLRSILRLFKTGFKKKKIKILSIMNTTPISYNGCRNKKKKR